MKALVTGGYFDNGGDGVVWLIDLTDERVDVLVRWTPPDHLRVPTKGFAGAHLHANGMLYAAAHAAVVRIDVRKADVTGMLHQPCMNDLHHVAALEDRLYVSNTGLSAVDVFSLDGTFLGSHSLLPAWVNALRIGGDDFAPTAPPVRPGWAGEAPALGSDEREDDGYYTHDRGSAPFHQLKVPDHLHVNHVNFVADRLLATCFADGTLRDLRTFEIAAKFHNTFLHDGILHGDALWLTAIDGSILELDASSLAERRRLSAFKTGHYGWCRGLAVTDRYLLAGLTEVRRARLPRHRWADSEPEGSETSVLMLDRYDGRLVARVDLTDAGRHSKLYSVLPYQESLP